VIPCVNTRQSIEGALVAVVKTRGGTDFQRSFLQKKRNGV
jgi:hypothetical protein